MSVDPRTLSSATALEARRSSSPSEICAVCQELLTDAPPDFQSTAFWTPTDREYEIESVIVKVCGDKHFFHRGCIKSWWLSASPSINTCPIDRAVAFGNTRVDQPTTDNVEYAEFLGHHPHPHDHGANVLVNDFIACLLYYLLLTGLVLSIVVPPLVIYLFAQSTLGFVRYWVVV